MCGYLQWRLGPEPRDELFSINMRVYIWERERSDPTPL
jgi:hypothetical protein